MGAHKVKPKETVKKKEDDSESDYEEGHTLIESSICRTKMIPNDEKLEHYRRFWVEMRQK